MSSWGRPHPCERCGVEVQWLAESRLPLGGRHYDTAGLGGVHSCMVEPIPDVHACYQCDQPVMDNEQLCGRCQRGAVVIPTMPVRATPASKRPTGHQLPELP